MSSLNKGRAVLGGLLVAAALACGGSENGNVEPSGEATNIAINAGDNQSAAPGVSVATAPSVKVTDADANPVSGVAITFAVALGGGSITGASQTTNGTGIATLGSWTLGPTAGTNTLTATAPGLTGSPVTFTATAEAITITAVSPASGALSGGSNVTITGTNFANVTSVSIGGSPVGSYTVASMTEITGTTPSSASPGATDVVVTSSSHGTGTCSGCFTYVSNEILPVKLVAGFGHTCGLTNSGAAYCWGLNDFRQLGNGSTTSSRTPVPVSGDLSFNAIRAGDLHTCGLTTAGAAYCWGWNEDGQLGDGSTTDKSVPVAVSGGLTFSALATAFAHTCGITDSGAAYCWGDNGHGQLGNDSFEDNSSPVAVSGELGFSALATHSSYHTCGLISSGAAYCWGWNFYGQLGDGSNVSSRAPVAVSGGLTFKALGAGHLFTCGLISSGAAYCWGSHDVGRLGTGMPSDPSLYTPIPVAVASGLSFSTLVLGGEHACGLTNSGKAYCWGSNWEGQVGNGSAPMSVLTPVAVSGDLSFSALAAGFRHTCGVISTGAVYCWGWNREGQLGNGSTTNSSIPVPVSGWPPP
jgi:alpha-tubulin suppressor-like RCC1 family protein